MNALWMHSTIYASILITISFYKKKSDFVLKLRFVFSSVAEKSFQHNLFRPKVRYDRRSALSSNYLKQRWICTKKVCAKRYAMNFVHLYYVSLPPVKAFSPSSVWRLPCTWASVFLKTYERHASLGSHHSCPICGNQRQRYGLVQLTLNVSCCLNWVWKITEIVVFVYWIHFAKKVSANVLSTGKPACAHDVHLSWYTINRYT